MPLSQGQADNRQVDVSVDVFPPVGNLPRSGRNWRAPADGEGIPLPTRAPSSSPNRTDVSARRAARFPRDRRRMPAMSNLGELQKKQAEAASFALRMAEEKDPDRLKAMAEQLQARCAELGRMAKGLEAALAPAGGRAETRVLLTAEQQKRIADQTGVGVEVVTLRDTSGRAWSKSMGSVEPREIEAMAARQAAVSRLKAETRTRVEKIIQELEKLAIPELADTIADLRRGIL